MSTENIDSTLAKFGTEAVDITQLLKTNISKNITLSEWNELVTRYGTTAADAKRMYDLLRQISSDMLAANDAANSALNTATAAKTASDNAVATADAASTNADEAKSTANTALANASAAVSTANAANENSKTARGEAEKAMVAADSVASDLANAVSTANAAKNDAVIAKAAIVALMPRVANAVKGVAKGSTIRIDDVSPISHTMAVKVKPKNILPYPYTAFVEAGSNEVTINGVTFTNNGDGTVTANGTATATTNLVLYDLADENRLKFDNSSLVLSGSIGGQVGRNKYYYLKMTAYQADGTETNVVQYSGSTKLPNGCSSSSKLQIVIISGKTVTNVVFKPQLEYGTTKTDYEAPIGDVTSLKVIQKNADDEVVAEYTPNSDGTVGGVTSLYPTTVLTTDRGTVSIECEYNRDTNKAIPKLYRHSITIWKPIQTYDSEGNLISGTANFSFKLAVYRSTADSLTLDDIDSHELSGVNGSFNYEDTPEGAAIVYNVRYVSSSKTLTVVYYSDIITASTTSMDFDQYNHNVSDTVTEV